MRGIEVAQIVFLVLPRPRRFPRSRHQSSIGRFSRRHLAQFHAHHRQIQRAWRYLHHHRRRASQRKLDRTGGGGVAMN